MKRIISLILCLILTLSTFCAVSAQATDIKDEHKALMKAIGYYSEGEDLSIKLTRGQFADLLVRSIYEQPQYLIDNSVTFNDVPETDPNFASINLLKTLEVSIGDENGNFNPNAEILVNDAVVMTVRFLGYKLYADRKGYLVVASEKELLDDLSFEYDEILTKRQALILIFNMLNADISDLQYTSSAASRLMSKERALFKVEGVVTDDGLVSKYGQSNVNINEVVINNTVFTNEANVSGIFGNEVVGYYKITEDKNPVLISVIVRSRGQSLKIDSEELISYDPVNYTYKYYDDPTHDHETEIEFTKDITVVYNFMPITADDVQFTNEYYMPKEGSILFYDNDGDGKYDLLYINSFKTIAVSSTDKTKESIYSKLLKDDGNPDRIELEKKEYTIINEKGKVAEFADIETDDILSVQESLDKKLVKIYISKTKKTGNFGGIDTDAGEILTQDGASYELTNGFITHLAEKLALSDDLTFKEKTAQVLSSFSVQNLYTFYVDIFGRLAYTEQVSSWDYGYIIQAGNNSKSSLNDSYVVKLYNDKTGVSDVSLAKKVNISDELGNPTARYEAKEVVDLINAHCEKYKYNRVVRLKKNSSAEITDIEFALLASIEKENIVGDRLCLLENLNNSGLYGAFYDNAAINNKFLLNWNTKIISTPLDNQGDDYKTVTYGILKVNSEYKMVPYTTDPTSFVADFMVMPEVISYIATDHNAVNFMIVDKVKEAYDREKDEKFYAITGYIFIPYGIIPIQTVTYYVRETDCDYVVNKIKDLQGTEKKLSNGDIIRFTLSKRHTDKQYIERATLYYDADVVDTVYGGTGSLTSVKGATLAEGNPSKYVMNADVISGTDVIPTYDTIALHDPNVANAVWNFTVGMGYVYSNNNNNLILTTQPLRTQSYSTLANDEYYTIAGQYIPTAYAHLIYKKTADSVKVELATADKIKTYKTHGNDCMKVFWANNYQLRFVVYFEE